MSHLHQLRLRSFQNSRHQDRRILLVGGGIISEAALAPLRPDAVSLMTLDLVIKCHDEVSRTFEYVMQCPMELNAETNV